MVSGTAILGSLVLAGGSVGYFTFPTMISMILGSLINLSENGMVYPLYMNPAFASRSTFRIYEIVNPREALRGKKMRFRIKGPYAFDTYLLKDNVDFNKNGQLIKYRAHRKLYPREDESADMDEKMWLINPIVPTAAKTVRAMLINRLPFQRVTEPVVFNAMNLILDNYKERLIMKATARELLLGRPVNLMADIYALANRFGLASLLPAAIPNNIFGIAYVQNVTTDDMEIWTGVSPTKQKFADVSQWRNQTRMKIWEGKCNIINGTNGELYKPFVKQGKPIKIFQSQLCRTIYLDPVGDGPTETKSGMKALEYEISKRIYTGARNNPGNKCFCPNKKTYDCQYDGLVTMGPCFFDAPIYFARPNFLGADKRILDLIEAETAIVPDLPTKQSLWLDQITGTVLQANLSLVATVKVIRQPYLRDLSAVQNLTYVPLFATTESITIPYELVWQIHALQVIYANYPYITLGSAAFGGGVLVFKMIFS